MDPQDNVCVCFKVSLHKLSHFLERERPSVPSQLSECLGAGTGCGWCVPFLCRLHAQHQAGQTLEVHASPDEYAQRRAAYKAAGKVHEDEDQTAARSWVTNASIETRSQHEREQP